MKKFISSSISKNISDSIKIAKSLNTGIEISRIPDYMNIDSKFEEIKENLKNNLLDFKNDINLHALFFDLTIASQDTAIRAISEKRYLQSFEIAKEINAKTIVFHSGYKPMKHKISQKKFIEKSVNFWQNFIKDFESAGITAVIENVLEPKPEIILDIVNGVNSNNLKASIDVGHANLASEIEIKQWIQKYSHNLTHMHLHNNFKDDDSHSSILKGTLNFEEIITAIIELGNYPDFVFEIFSTEELYESIEFFDKFMENKKCLIN